jgi:uncharacterized protein YbcI
VAHHHSPSDERMATRISDDLTRLYLDTFGKGPLHAETFVNGDVVTTLLREVFTLAEKSMVDDGQADSVLATRTQWQSATDERFRSAVAEATGRSVLAAISGFDAVHDLASEVFVLAPESGWSSASAAG